MSGTISEPERPPWRDPWILAFLATYILAPLLVNAARAWLEPTPFGRHLVSAGASLSYALTRTVKAADGEPPVWVVDVSRIPPRGGVTEADDLVRVLENVLDHHPAAIAVDIDVSPTEGAGSELEHKALILRAVQLSERTGIPIVFAAVRSLSFAPAERWLGPPELSELAGAAVSFSEDARFYPRRLRARHLEGEMGPSLAKRLLDAAGVEERRTPLVAAVFGTARGEGAPEDARTELEVEAVLLDYGYLGSKEEYTVECSEDGTLGANAEGLGGKLVLVGDADRDASGSDYLVAVGEAVPGVYVHACAGYTMGWGPIRDIRPVFRGMLTWGFTLLFVLQAFSVFAEAWHRRAGAGPRPPWSRWTRLLLRMTTLGVLARLGSPDAPLARVEKVVLLTWFSQIGLLFLATVALSLFRVVALDLAFLSVFIMVETLLHQFMLLFGVDILGALRRKTAPAH